MVRSLKFESGLSYNQLLSFTRKNLIFLEVFNIKGEITLFWRIFVPLTKLIFLDLVNFLKMFDIFFVLSQKKKIMASILFV